MPRPVWLVAALTLLAACAGPREHDLDAGNVPGELEYAGLTRSYFVHVPRQHDDARPLPLVVALHGGRGNGRAAARLSGLNAEADRSGFLVVYPDAVDGNWNDGRAVEAYRAQRDNIDDVGFLTTLIERLADDYRIDRQRVYVTGASNGAFMANRLACERSEQIAAIAPVIGSMAANVAETCRPARAMPVLMINGMADPLVPWNGDHVQFRSRQLGRMLPGPELLRFWVRHNGCRDEPQMTLLPDADPDDGTRVMLSRYGECRDGAAVLLYAIDGGGHTWPRGLPYLPQWLIGRVSQDLDANQVIWEFFSRHRRSP